MLSPKLEWWHGNQDKKVEVSDSFKNANATGTRKPLKVENFGIAATPEKTNQPITGFHVQQLSLS